MRACVTFLKRTLKMSSSSILKNPGGSRTNRQASRQTSKQASKHARRQLSKYAGKHLGGHSVGAMPCRGLFI